MSQQFSNAYQEGIYKAKVAITQQLHKQYYLLCIENDMPLPQELKQLKSLHAQIQQLKQSRKNDQVKTWMLTLNPPMESGWSNLQKVVEKLLEYKDFLIDPEVQYEQRSEDVDKPYGWHVHIACKLGRSHKNTIDTVFRAMEKIISSSTRQSVDLRRSNKAYDYVKGKKDDDSKNAKMEVDKVLRESLLGLPKKKKNLVIEYNKNVKISNKVEVKGAFQQSINT